MGKDLGVSEECGWTSVKMIGAQQHFGVGVGLPSGGLDSRGEQG